MKRLLRSMILACLRELGKSRLVQALILSPQELAPMSEFTDSNGKSHTLFAGYRDSIKPEWRRMFNPLGEEAFSKTLTQKVSNARKAVAELEHFLQFHGLSLSGRSVLEIGCDYGAHAYAMAELGATHVVGIDIPQYGARQSGEANPGNEAIARQSHKFDYRRQQMSTLFNASVRSLVSFRDCDVANLADKGIYDAVVSWETLEHIQEPRTAFERMHDALKPGGFSFHEYNPFFSENGGHSLCTLDFPWGHCRLSTGDFKRYIRTMRPEEENAAIAFYEYGLNRMTLADLQSYARDAGFTIVSFLPWLSKHGILKVRPDMLREVLALYPSASEHDLLAGLVWILARRALD